MSDPLHATVADTEATDARFSVRAVLKVMAVVAVVAAVLGPVVRQLDAGEQRRLLTAWGLWLVAAVVWIGSQARRRFEAERLAGRTIVRLPMSDERVPAMSPERRFFNGLGASILALLFFAVLSFLALQDASTRWPGSIWVVCAGYGIMSVGLASRVVFSLWWRKSIRFGESGVLWDRTLVFWTHMIGHRWRESGVLVGHRWRGWGLLELHGSDQNGSEAKIKVAIPPERRDSVEQLLEAKAADRPSVAAVDAGTGTGKSSRADTRRTVGKATMVATGILLGGSIFYLTEQVLSATAEFRDMLIAGILAGAVSQTVMGTMLPKRAGAPLVRLYGRVGLGPSLALFAVCVACYFIGTSYAWTRPWLARLTGLGCGMTLMLSSLPGIFTHFELREGGVFFPGRFLWRWPTVRLIQWDRDGTGRLVLGRGWRRIVARVPAEQRSAVDKVLFEKLCLSATRDADSPK